MQRRTEPVQVHFQMLIRVARLHFRGQFRMIMVQPSVEDQDIIPVGLSRIAGT
jgi:hypothetical protein